MSVCLLASGGLGLKILQHIFHWRHDLVAVFTDKGSEEIISFCENNQIPLFAGNPRNGKADDFIKRIECEVLLSVNYLFIIEDDLIRLPKKYATNIHGSLLPKYRGRTPHVWAIINGEKETGITAHLIDNEVDNGDIIMQLKIPIGEEDTGGDILKKFNEQYPVIVKKLLEDISDNRIHLKEQDQTKATYFGKRTPDDGLINWHWCRERIRNWIRAQAKPYPGAFTFYKDKKMIIHHCSFSDYGFHYEQTNGTILKADQNALLVKTPNGVLCIDDIEFEEPIQPGIILR